MAAKRATKASGPGRRTSAALSSPEEGADGEERVADRSVLQSVQRAASVLDEVARRKGSVTIGEIASSLNLDRTIVYRLIKTLEGEALLEPSRGGYVMGPRALLFGNAYLETLNVLRVALPYQLALLERVLKGRPWTTAILVLVGNELALVDTIWNVDAPLDIQLSLGRRFPLVNTALGHALLAYREPREVEALIGREAAAALVEEFAAIRDARGIAFIHDQVQGVSAVAAVIFDRPDHPVTGIMVGGLEMEDHLRADSDVAKTLRRTADAIAQMLP
jgi:IclR family transcriptional regulator, pca regulon regulatory protein